MGGWEDDGRRDTVPRVIVADALGAMPPKRPNGCCGTNNRRAFFLPSFVVVNRSPLHASKDRNAALSGVQVLPPRRETWTFSPPRPH
jgi:hypothetical protein